MVRPLCVAFGMACLRIWRENTHGMGRDLTGIQDEHMAQKEVLRQPGQVRSGPNDKIKLQGEVLLVVPPT